MGYLESGGTTVAGGRRVTTAKHSFLSTYQMAKLCRVDERTIRRWVKKGKLRAVWLVDPPHYSQGMRSGRWAIESNYAKKFVKYSLLHNDFEIHELNREYDDTCVRRDMNSPAKSI